MIKKISLLFIVLFIGISVFASNDTIRVLAIGNSFSEDAVENYLHDLGKSDRVVIIIGNLYIGGCSLETHWNNAKNDLTAYSYRKIDASGKKTVTPNTKLSQAIADEKWDYISFQQVSSNAGIYDSYFPYLPDLFDYVKKRTTNPAVKYMLHMTWAYAQTSTHAGFANYNKNQMQMYQAIVKTVNRIAKAEKIRMIIPTGTAIQNGRASSLGDTFCRDGYHLNLLFGRYTAACTWYEKLTRHSVIGNAFAPASLSKEEIHIAQESAHNAVHHPDNIIKPKQ